MAHGAAVDGAANRYNLVRIKVSPGLDYYVEVRQRPPGRIVPGLRHQHPDPAGSGRNGGVIVTKAITDELDNNQQTRLVTLLHDPTVLLTGDVATDPLRTLTITVVNDQVVYQSPGLPGAGGMGPGDRRHARRRLRPVDHPVGAGVRDGRRLDRPESVRVLRLHRPVRQSDRQW